ncbi:uncharacterized protein KGF55_003662 [Candida pseudojiufengensis]|uniref:uncharacterized protein n=1 Tax=Candida pseudojiufengensis TaxID=497109 RepID=UPI002223F296|nr:uncharacterized protein KGF55_003662 [Candida pseudojiufengensis]KAI5962586.1 hypothetical protein KGF55_003662 [Candida pseudojiufengensis]
MNSPGLDLDIESDDTLNLEKKFYNLGYQEGIQQSTREQYLEGKQFGYQTGFQRFLIVGYIKGLINDWNSNLKKYESNQQQQIQNHLTQLTNFVNNITLINSDSEVEKFEKNLSKSKRKLRIIVGITKEHWKIENLDELINKVGGNMQLSENVDEMW